MSYFKLINGIKDLLSSIDGINTVTEGYVEEKEKFLENKTTIAHISVESGSVLDNLNTYDVVVSFLDSVVENNNITKDVFMGNDNIQEVYNSTDHKARKFFMEFRKQAEGTNIFIEGLPNLDKTRDYETMNRVAGWDLTFTVGVPNDKINVCEAI